MTEEKGEKGKGRSRVHGKRKKEREKRQFSKLIGLQL